MIEEIVKQTEKDCVTEHQKVDSIVAFNQKKVLDAFIKNRVSDSHFHSTTGYGYDDAGREALEAVYADVFGGEDALVRPQIVSGTHAITTALFGLLRPNDELMYITGKPYDTLEEVIGIRGNSAGSLKDYHVAYKQVDLSEGGRIDLPAVREAITKQTKVIGIQRSKGYDDRPSITIEEIKEAVAFIKDINEEIIIFVDNCYGEFVEKQEPLEVGADIIAGSLIKNPGGGIVRAGGYIAGRQDLIFMCGNRLTAPGLGKETGATFDMLREMFQGFFLAPHVVGEALKGAIFTSRFLELIGFRTTPHYKAKRTDLIQSVTFEAADQMIAFSQAIQKNSPVNSYVTPYPSEMPGYEDKVIMAAGTFIQGASIELSADGPIREPYTVFIQGGLTYAHVKIALIEAVKALGV
ncbi:aminotransferase class I/II-fold pyridoxal phosphate-dependent enzyme [Oceanobacillus bengalensis]|uniref:Methionine gamma-lyase family protein n=1 Tax=Oceanobacillus bengalensis TaxID=1435466 RepID=A0A494Z430_9BACI|nr:methionine gamma-lyase family protein [Oceanobacillus bengalensis]RKQ17294.1 methionine gamma-lyase family protein [Oceanobacillus bengalensis]